MVVVNAATDQSLVTTVCGIVLIATMRLWSSVDLASPVEAIVGVANKDAAAAVVVSVTEVD